LWKVPEDHDNSIKLLPLSEGKNSLFNFVATFGVIGSTPRPEATVKIVTASDRGEDRIIFGKVNV
jgi:hypothetical protein